MEPEEFIEYVESLYNAGKTGNSPQSKIFFRAIYIGYEYPNFRPPDQSRAAQDGYEIGLELREQYHEKFK